ncbi:GNAT family N-acetyltransferase [Psychroserpens algicola]|uniref:GNAT family N-acetyltransferase n=1 Tax=Psychroserpens algicola TaxID=1719034 RepID=A0ABT0H7I2_9FLAO|nr:GNAT family N-acetyltransferase [Psychroserpens algicola]MCK8479800.1 GNAT family N-acetyltransferase [Psychroserpens algicola]
MVFQTNKSIDTGDILLIANDIEILKTALKGNAELAKYLNINIAANWTEFGTDYLEYSMDKYLSNKNEQDWLIYFPILKTENTLIGSCGYKGMPTTEGCVEIGYEIAPDYRNKRYATQITKALITNAFESNLVNSIIAHTLTKKGASTKILSKFGFKKIEVINDPDDGAIWKWELKKINFNSPK